MTVKDILRGIQKLNTFLLEKELAQDTNSPSIRSQGDIQEITWSGAPKSGLISGSFATLAEYLIVIKNRQFNCSLIDGGVFQFNYFFDNDDLIKQRLCYFPCPIEITEDEVNKIQPGDDFVSLFQMLLTEELDLIRKSILHSRQGEKMPNFFFRTPIRFDYDPFSQAHGHSASHLHINKPACRWPVFGPISLGHFIRFVFKMFYTDIWNNNQQIRNWPISHHSRTVSDIEVVNLYIDSKP